MHFSERERNVLTLISLHGTLTILPDQFGSMAELTLGVISRSMLDMVGVTDGGASRILVGSWTRRVHLHVRYAWGFK